MQILHAQQYNISRFTSKNGLAQNQCRSITTDSLGFLWIGTFEGGLSKYDGHQFDNYNKINELGSNFIFKVVAEKNNRIWLATENGIVSIFGKNTNYFLRNDSIKIKIEALAIDQNDKIWFGHPQLGVGFIINDQVTFPDISFKGDQEIIRIFCDYNNGIWFSTLKNGLYRYQNGNIKAIPLKHDALKNESVLSFNINRQQNYLIGSTNGLFELSSDLQNCTEVYPELNNRTITSIFKDSKERTWFATLNGSYFLQNNKLKWLSTNHGLTENIYDITEDFEGGIWFCSNKGIYRLNNNFLHTYNSNHGLSDDLVWSIAEDKFGKTWLSTASGLNVLDNQKIVIPKALPKNLKRWASPLLVDKDSNLLIGSVSSVYRYDGDHFREFKVNSVEEEIYFNGAFIRKNGDALFAGSQGISVLHQQQLHEFIPSDLLNNKKINTITEDKKGNVWIGTEGGGIFIVDNKITKEDNSLVIKQLRTEKGSLVTNIINVLYTDTDGNIWMGTSGNGLFKFPKGNFENPPVSFEDADLSSTNIYSIIQDDSKNIWVGTDQGLNKICILQNDFIKVKVYGEQEGFLPLEVCHNAVTKNANGSLWFGTVEGAVNINPNEDAYGYSLPRVSMDDIQVFFQEVDWNEFAEEVDSYTGLPLNSMAAIPNEENHLVFNFSAIGYNIPSKIRYQWKLDGLDREWTPPSTINEAIYPNIPPGKYDLKIKAINAAGLSSETPYSFQFEITKPFYQTKAFILFAIILCFALTYFNYKGRVKNLKKYQKRLELKVRQRTKEIEEQNEKMRAQSKKLSTAMKEIYKKNQELINANKNRIRSLAYASKIQNAVMFAKKDLHNALPSAFIFSQPKDLVCSDFYWTKEYEDYIFVILVDCTNHGVPGAFLSMIGFEYLSEIIDLMEVHDPAKILTELNLKISSALRQSNENELVDGMDVAICRINKKTNTVTFSGARRPLHYVENNELHVIKGNISGAGINLQNQEPEFTNVHINLQPDTTLFLFSDGYPNQFNKQGQKFKISNFKKLLLEITQIETELEKVTRLSLELNNWIEGYEQLDDVLVIGFNYYNTQIPSVKRKKRKVQKTSE